MIHFSNGFVYRVVWALKALFHRVMYIAPSSGHISLNFNMPFKLILRRFDVVFWCLSAISSGLNHLHHIWQIGSITAGPCVSDLFCIAFFFIWIKKQCLFHRTERKYYNHQLLSMLFAKLTCHRRTFNIPLITIGMRMWGKSMGLTRLGTVRGEIIIIVNFITTEK